MELWASGSVGSTCKDQGSVKFGKQMLPCVFSLLLIIGWNGGHEAALLKIRRH